MNTTDDDSNRAVEPNQAPTHPDLPGGGPGGRGFESRRSPLTNSLQSGTIGRSQEAAPDATGSNSGSNLGSEQGSSEGSEDPPPRPRLRGDESELFRSFHGKLRRAVRRLVDTSPDIVDDACNFAWMEFIRCQPDRERSWRSWLITVAQREAWKLHAKEASHDGAEIPGRDGLLHEPADPRDMLSVRAELRVALDSLAAVPDRRGQVKALQVTGFTYVEIGERLGLGHTRVTEANAAIRKERERLAPARSSAPARAQRLEELQDRPPTWLTNAIGQPPGRRVPGQVVLPWQRAALAIDDIIGRRRAITTDVRPANRDCESGLDEPLGRTPHRTTAMP